MKGTVHADALGK